MTEKNFKNINMKKLILMLSILSILGCKQKNSVKKNQAANNVTPTNTNATKNYPDTTIYQNASYNKEVNKYELITIVVIDDGTPKCGIMYFRSEIERENYYNSFRPYSNKVIGSFDEIKTAKKGEYNKAKNFIDAKERKDKEVSSNLDILNGIDVK
jgi:hypothetical protein